MRLPRLLSALNAALIALAVVVVPIYSAPATNGRTDAEPPAVEKIGKLPVIFERNDGQFPPQFDYASRANGQVVFVHSGGARMFVGGDEAPAELGLTFAGARRDAKKAGGDVSTITNYFLGNDPAKWRAGVPSYNTVRYTGVYPGIDVEYHARRGTLEYDFVVAPGADWRSIALKFDGAKPVLDESGDLVLKAGKSEIRHRAPYAYQEIGGEKKTVESRYAVKNGRVSFVLGAFDRSAPLIIDPVLDFSRVIHPLTGLFPEDILLAANGDMVVAGTVWAPSSAALSGAPVAWDSRDAMVTRLDPSGNVLFTTYLGGTRHDFGVALALDGDGNIHFVAETGSGDFPTTAGVIGEHTGRLSTIYGEPRAGVVKLSGGNGAIVYSTYLEDRRVGAAGYTYPRDIAVDSLRRAIVTGYSYSDKFPVTPGAFDPTHVGGFLTKLSVDATTLAFSTHLTYGNPRTITTDTDDNIYVAGAAPTGTAGFASPGAYRTDYLKGFDSFIGKYDETGNRIFQTYFPGEIYDIAIDSSRNVIAAGLSVYNNTPATPTSPTVPTTPTAYQRVKNGSNDDAYLAKLSASGATLLAATFFGGTEDEVIDNVRIGPNNEIFVTGAAVSGNLPMANPIQSTHYDVQTAGTRGPYASDFIAKFDSNLESLLFSTYFGPGIISGFVLDPSANIVFTAGGGGPATWMRGPQDPWAIVEGDAIVARLNMAAPIESFAVHEVSPAAAPANTGGNLEIRGHGFVPGQMEVFFGDAETLGQITVFGGGTRMLVPIPAHAPGVVDIRVVHPNSTSITRLAEFTFLGPMPTRTVLTPESISSLGGNITITGEHITAETQISYRGVGTAPLGQPDYLGGLSLGRGYMRTPPTSISFQMGPLKRYLSVGEFRMLPVPGVFSTAIYSFPIQQAPQPSITEIHPVGGPTTGGTELTISGFGFHPQARVIVGSVFARQVTFLNSNALTCIVPPNTGGPVTVHVMNPDDGYGSLVNGYTYRGIGSLSPTSGPITGGTAVTIKGFGFSAGAASVTFGGVAATSVTVVNDTTLTVDTPAHTAGFVDVIVTIGSSTYVASSAFRYLDPPPVVTSVAPAQGPDTGGTVVTITGTGFQIGASVTFGGIAAANVSFVSATELTATTAAGLAGVVNVSVRNPDDQIGSLPSSFTYRGITSFTPSQAQPGTNVTITGAGFETGATVTFGGTAATATVNSSTSITATVPARDPGIVTVVVTNPSTETFTKAGVFRVLAPPPTITSFTPANGLPGDPVTITGTNFDMVTSVKLANVSANFVVDSLTQITATVPVTQAATGPITVETLSGIANSASNFTIENAAAEIASFSPGSGDQTTLVTIVGDKFGGATAVRFGGLDATDYTIVSSNQIEAHPPANGISGPICITTPGPFVGCSATDFLFAPRITSFSPSNGVPGTVVTLTGANFTGATSVAFNGVSATTFNVDSATTITVTVPAAATTGPITVTTAGGTGTSATPFGVPPSITSFSPPTTGVGNTVTISGVRFNGATAVAFNAAAATSFNVVNDSTITAVVPAGATDGPITVTTPGGIATSPNSFVVAPTPVIASFSPIAGDPGTVVTINGTGMDTTTAVKFNGIHATSFTIINSTQVTATVPNTATNGPISVENMVGAGTSTAIFSLAPVLSSFSPNAGSPGTVITINGNNFLGASTVHFNTTSATFTIVSNVQITATVPAGATTGKLKVTTAYGPAYSVFNFTVLSNVMPTVSAVAIGTNSISVSWSGDPTHTYQVRRITSKNQNFGANGIANVTGTTYVDNSVAAGVTYLYNIYDVTNGQTGNHDYATTILFTDDPLAAGVAVKTAHLTELRAAVNAMRTVAALGPATFTDTAASGLVIRALHITQLRNALNEALLQLGRYAEFTDSPLNSGAPIRVAHLRDLREAVK